MEHLRRTVIYGLVLQLHINDSSEVAWRKNMISTEGELCICTERGKRACIRLTVNHVYIVCVAERNAIRSSLLPTLRPVPQLRARNNAHMLFDS